MWTKANKYSIFMIRGCLLQYNSRAGVLVLFHLWYHLIQFILEHINELREFTAAAELYILIFGKQIRLSFPNKSLQNPWLVSLFSFTFICNPNYSVKNIETLKYLLISFDVEFVMKSESLIYNIFSVSVILFPVQDFSHCNYKIKHKSS